MNIVSLNDETYGDELDSVGSYDYTDFIYLYYEGCYDGSGYGIGIHPDKSFDVWDLSHCSCYGPLDSGPSDTCPQSCSVRGAIGADENGNRYGRNYTSLINAVEEALSR
jgi:hypothetical protein